jgi:hypothetical protein
MVSLTRKDAYILAKVAIYKGLDPVRRRNLLNAASYAARVIGLIIINGNEAGCSPEYVRAAHSIIAWAKEERSK